MLRHLPTRLLRQCSISGTISRTFASTAIPAFVASHRFDQQVLVNDLLVHKNTEDHSLFRSEGIVYPTMAATASTTIGPSGQTAATIVSMESVFHRHSPLANDLIRDDDPEHVVIMYPSTDRELEMEEVATTKAKQHRSSASNVVLDELCEEERMVKLSSDSTYRSGIMDVDDPPKSKGVRAAGPQMAHDIQNYKLTKHVDPPMRKVHEGPKVGKDTIGEMVVSSHSSNRVKDIADSSTKVDEHSPNKQGSRASGPEMAHDVATFEFKTHVDPPTRKVHQGPRIGKDTL